MRIQHNIAAMNSYRNYMGNNNALSKNLEKLSSGYRINRAGDDAAGLAISEKMRAQITGLDASQKNVQDGISLVKTAEGAMQEIHDMLNRMDYLATQSANGTYDNEVDRANLQKEVDALKDEINRIADSSNFNGINLLDGSLSGDSQLKNVTVSNTTAVKGEYQTGAFVDGQVVIGSGKFTTDDIGKSLDYTVSWTDGAGNEKTTKVSLTFQGDGKGKIDTNNTANNYFLDASGARRNVDTNGKLLKTDLEAAIKASLEADDTFAANFEITSSTGNTLVFKAKADGSAGAVVKSVGLSETTSLEHKDVWGTSNSASNEITIATNAYDSMQKIDGSSAFKVADKSLKPEEIDSKIFEIDGHKFLLHKDLTDEQLKGLDSDVHVMKVAGTTPTNAEISTIASEITRVTGLETKIFTTAPTGTGITADTDIVFTKDKLALSGNSLKLQIGDSSESYNQLKVKVGDMHTDALGISALDISNLDGANAAIDKIRSAINSVSGVRGDLGATQNRLEHTANNLSVMEENIQNAESAIRDTDLADEMTTYTKNNILLQSAQAMLAQANQQPQGVLQLLQ